MSYDFYEEIRDEDYERSRRDHPAIWHGPSRYSGVCPVCGREMRAGELQAPHWRPNGLKVCSSCREQDRRNQHIEPLRKPIR